MVIGIACLLAYIRIFRLKSHSLSCRGIYRFLDTLLSRDEHNQSTHFTSNA